MSHVTMHLVHVDVKKMLSVTTAKTPQERIAEAAKKGRGKRPLQEIATRAGVAPNTIRKVERGGNANINSVVRVLGALGLRVSDLLDEPVEGAEQLLPGWDVLDDAEKRHIRELVALFAGRHTSDSGLPAEEADTVQRRRAQLETLSDAAASEDAGRRDTTSTRGARSGQGSANPRGGTRRRVQQSDSGS